MTINQNLPMNIYYLQKPASLAPTIGDIIGRGETRTIDSKVVALLHDNGFTFIVIGHHVIQLLGRYDFDELYFHHHTDGSPIIASGSIVWKLSSFRNEKELREVFENFTEWVIPTRKFETIHFRVVYELYMQITH